jgi:hypothetical protein
LLGSRRHVEECRPDFVLDTLAQIVELSLTLLPNGFRLDDVGFDLSSLKDRTLTRLLR